VQTVSFNLRVFSRGATLVLEVGGTSYIYYLTARRCPHGPHCCLVLYHIPMIKLEGDKNAISECGGDM
jgi:hypothetical protein